MDHLLKHYRTLEINSDASLKDVKKARGILLRAWHPDRFSNDAEMQEHAKSKTQQINAAYEAIEAHMRGGEPDFDTPSTGESCGQSGDEQQAQAHGNHSETSKTDGPMNSYQIGRYGKFVAGVLIFIVLLLAFQEAGIWIGAIGFLVYAIVARRKLRITLLVLAGAAGLAAGGSYYYDEVWVDRVQPVTAVWDLQTSHDRREVLFRKGKPDSVESSDGSGRVWRYYENPKYKNRPTYLIVFGESSQNDPNDEIEFIYAFPSNSGGHYPFGFDSSSTTEDVIAKCGNPLSQWEDQEGSRRWLEYPTLGINFAFRKNSLEGYKIYDSP